MQEEYNEYDSLFDETEKLDSMIGEDLKIKLNAFLRNIYNYQNKINEQMEVAGGLIKEIENKRDIICEKYQKRIDSMSNVLNDYMNVQYNNSNGKVKSEEFLYGLIGLRKNPAKIEIEDEKKLMIQLKELGLNNILKNKDVVSIDKKELKKFVEENPDKLENVKLIDGNLNFYIKFGE